MVAGTVPVVPGQSSGDGRRRCDGLDAADVAADARVVGAAADADVADVARRAVGPVVQHALAGDEPAADARSDLHEQQRRLVRGQRSGFAERAQVDVVLQDRRAVEPALQPCRDRVGVPAGHDRRAHRRAQDAVDRAGESDHDRAGGHLGRTLLPQRVQPGFDGVEHRLRGPRGRRGRRARGPPPAGSGRPPRGGHRAHPGRRAAPARRGGTAPAGRRGGRDRGSDGCPRSAPRRGPAVRRPPRSPWCGPFPSRAPGRPCSARPRTRPAAPRC